MVFLVGEGEGDEISFDKVHSIFLVVDGRGICSKEEEQVEDIWLVIQGMSREQRPGPGRCKG